jgi:hypothetical protein
MITVKKYNKNIYINKYIPTSGFIALAFFNVIFWREEYDHYLFNDRYNNYVKHVVNHENIHIAQMKDFCKWLPLGAIIFYIAYFFEWLYRICKHGFKNAYSNISFEREAKQYESSDLYLSYREKFKNYKL